MENTVEVDGEMGAALKGSEFTGCSALTSRADRASQKDPSTRTPARHHGIFNWAQRVETALDVCRGADPDAVIITSPQLCRSTDPVRPRAVRRAYDGHGRRFDGCRTGMTVPFPRRREVLRTVHGTGRPTGRPARVTGQGRGLDFIFWLVAFAPAGSTLIRG
ncbi:hypothetical protein DFH09DRAFT_1095818 [Mycena vulgaris]|nr:hypothetical protein DFH09DRAFT_1095818 [Mycena vulgaris]